MKGPYKKMIVLTPGIFVETLPGIILETNNQKDKKESIFNKTQFNGKESKIYPIELHGKGNNGNIGVNISQNLTFNGVYTLFFQVQVQ